MTYQSRTRWSEYPVIVLVGFYGSGNFGDDVMCFALAQFLTQNTDARVRIITRDPASHAGLRGERVELRPRTAFEIWRAIREADILCQGGGTNFHDSYAGRKLVRHWGNILLWAAIFWIARLSGKRVLLVGAGIGPLRHVVSRLLSKIAFTACTEIGVRDQASARTLARILPRRSCQVGFDLAAILSSAKQRAIRMVVEPKVLGISGCSLTEFLGSSQLNVSYWESLGQALSIFHAQQPLRIKFFSLFTGQSSAADDAIADIIQTQLPPDLPFERRRYQGSIEQFASELSDADWFLCTKYHAAVMTYLWSCNFAVITYNRKLTDLADEIGLPPERRIDANAPQSVNTWLTILHSLASRDISADLLARREAEDRATRVVHRIFEQCGVTIRRAPTAAA